MQQLKPKKKPRGIPFKKGQSGNPSGRPRSNLNAALAEFMQRKAENGKTYTENLVLRVSSLALAGDLKAIEFIWDRLEGKVAQPMEHSGKLTLDQLVLASLGEKKVE